MQLTLQGIPPIKHPEDSKGIRFDPISESCLSTTLQVFALGVVRATWANFRRTFSASRQGCSATQPYQVEVNSRQFVKLVSTSAPLRSHREHQPKRADHDQRDGKIKTAFCKFPPNESASQPTIFGDHKPPNRWIVKIETAMPLAKRFAGADASQVTGSYASATTPVWVRAAASESAPPEWIFAPLD